MAKPAVTSPQPSPIPVEVLIIGAGPSGLSTCIKLRQQGVHDVVVLDRASRIGGTWALNDYPGLRCDVPSELYSLGYAPKPDWSRSYAPQAEIRDYLENVARHFGIIPQIRLSTEVTDARWHEAEKKWHVLTANGDLYKARILVAAPGYIGEAKLPQFPGQEQFKGTIFHSGAWNHQHDLTGERVAAIGCGASAIQFVPAIQPIAKEVISVQRTPSWVLPKPDIEMPAIVGTVFKRVPLLQRMTREAGLLGLESFLPVFMHEQWVRRITHPLGIWNINRSVKDPELRRRLTPTQTLGCKRPLFSNDWYATMVKPNVKVEFQGLRRITETGIVLEDSKEIPVDTIIFGTGYAVESPLIYSIIFGASGKNLSQHWQGEPRAYQGVAIHEYPNFFLMLGPNSHSVQGSVMWTCEQQGAYIAHAIQKMISKGIKRFEVKKPVQDAFNAHIDTRLKRMPIRADVCSSYYLDRAGRNQFVWPEYGFKIKQRYANVDLSDYHMQ